MKLTTYPDGPYHAVLHIWHRHPRWSVTWTYILDALWMRPHTNEQFARVIHWPYGSQREYGLKLWRLRVEVRRQDPMAWPAAAE